MALPAGYSSDEDDLDGFGDETFNIQRNNSIFTPEIEKNRKLDDLFIAVVNGNYVEIEKELQGGLDPNTILKDNWSLLLLAASVGNPKITKLLIEQGADVNHDKDKYTTLMAACNCPSSCSSYENVLDVVQQLVDKGANVDAVNRKRMTALMFACSTGNVEVVKLLLPLSNKFATDNQGWNALFWAVNDNRAEIVELLLEEGFNESQVDVRGNTALSYAKKHNNQKIAQLLFPSQQDVREEVYCSSSNNFELVFENLQSGESPQYLNEIYNILCGCRSEKAMSYFIDSNINLKTFLCMNDGQLQSLGTLLPFQRYRILNGLHRFHKYPFKQISLPNVQNDELYSNIETAKSVAAAIRQIICMEASVEYLIVNSDSFRDNIDKNALRGAIKNVCDRLMKLKNASKALHQKTQYWDYLNSPADLISKKSKKKRRYIPKIAVMGILLITIATCKFLWSKR